MRRLTLAALLALTVAPGAMAQGSPDVPIQRDLRRMDRLDRNRPARVNPNVTPDNPDGVVGFDGPPDPYGDDIMDSGPLPPGSPADIDDD